MLDANRPTIRDAHAVWALGKTFSPNYRPLFESVLREHIVGDPDTLFQAMIALDDLGVKIFGTNRSMSIGETESNRTLCREYLAILDP